MNHPLFETVLSFLKNYLVETVLFVLFAWIYLANIDSPWTWSPEAIDFIQTARNHFIQDPWNAGSLNPPTPPLFSWMLFISMQVFGLGLWTAQLPSALFALASIVLVYVLAKDLFESRETGFYSASILATTWGFLSVGERLNGECLSLTLLLLANVWVHTWYPMAQRHKTFKRDIRIVCALLGVTTALLFLAKGSAGLLMLAIIAGGFHFVEVLKQFKGSYVFEWKFFWGGFGLLFVPWMIGTLIFPDRNGSFFLYLFGTFAPSFKSMSWLRMFGPDGLAQILSLISKTLPWTFFMLISLYSLFFKREDRKFWNDHERSLLFLGLWSAAVFLYGLFSGNTSQSMLLPLLVPLSMLAGAYLSKGVEKSHMSLSFRLAADGTTILLVALSVLSAIIVFQILPDTYPGALWNMPGMAEVSEISMPFLEHVSLPFHFPIWKLWLIPGPFIFLFGGILLFALTTTGRGYNTPEALTVTMIIFILFATTIASPVFSRPIGKHYASFLNKRLKNGDQILVYNPPEIFIAKPVAKTLFYLNPSLPKETFQFAATPEAFSKVLDRRERGQALYGILPEKDYYLLKNRDRKRIRVMKSEWQWLFRENLRQRFFGRHGAMAPLREHVLLFEAIPSPREQGIIHPVTKQKQAAKRS